MGSGKKIIKKVVKTVNKANFLTKDLPGGWDDPLGNALAGNESPLDGMTGAATKRAAESDAKAALESANIEATAQREQTNSIMEQSRYAAQSAAQAQALDAANRQAQAAANENNGDQVSTAPTVDLSLGAAADETPSARRKRYQSGSGSVGGSATSGSVRL